MAASIKSKLAHVELGRQDGGQGLLVLYRENHVEDCVDGLDAAFEEGKSERRKRFLWWTGSISLGRLSFVSKSGDQRDFLQLLTWAAGDTKISVLAASLIPLILSSTARRIPVSPF